MDRPKLTIDFPTKAHLDDFVSWLSDGGGEYIYMEYPCRDEEFKEIPPIVEFDYSDFDDWSIIHCYQEMDPSP